MLNKITTVFIFIFLIFNSSSTHAQNENKSNNQELLLRKITGKPVIDSPQLLNWPLEHGESLLDVSEPTSNILHDFHGDLNDCEISLSTQGNFHSALAEIWPKYLDLFPKNNPLKNWFYFGGMAIADEQISSGFIQVGNFKVRCKPQVVLINFGEITKLQQKGFLDGNYIPFSKVRGYVTLVKKGNPKKIKTITDLARADVSFVTPSPTREPGSFVTTVRILYKMIQLEAAKNKLSPDQFLDQMFNSKANKKKIKWLAVNTFAHRGVPWSIAYGRGDASILPLQMARNIVKIFPDIFEIVEMKNGESETLFPNSHNGELFIARVKGNWSARQKEAQNKLVDILLSEEFTKILLDHGIDRIKI